MSDTVRMRIRQANFLILNGGSRMEAARELHAALRLLDNGEYLGTNPGRGNPGLLIDDPLPADEKPDLTVHPNRRRPLAPKRKPADEETKP